MTSWHEFHQYGLENGGMDDPPDPYCPECGAYTRSGVICESCALGEHEDDAVFTHCNVCGKPLREPEEDEMGMCNDCGNME
jgi:hypothetical protein